MGFPSRIFGLTVIPSKMVVSIIVLIRILGTIVPVLRLSKSLDDTIWNALRAAANQGMASSSIADALPSSR